MTIERRRFVAEVASVTGVLSLAGCAGDGGVTDGIDDGEDGGNGGSDTDTSDIELADTDFDTVDGETRGTFEFTNDGGQEGEVTFATALRIGTDGIYGTHRNERTVAVPAGESTTVEMVLLEADRLSAVAREELSDGYVEVALATDGEEVETVSFGERPSRHVSFRVVYGGRWQGAVGGESGVRNVQGSGTDHLSVDNDARILSGNAQKGDGSAERLVVQFLVDGDVVAEQATTAQYGVAQVTAEPTDSPLGDPTEPYEPPEVTVTGRQLNDPTDGADSGSTDEPEVDPAEVPGEDAAKETVERYYDSLTRADADAVNALIHPDSPGTGVTEEEIEDLEQFDYEIDEIAVTSLDRQRGRATVEGEITLLGEDDTTEGPIPFEFELRVHDGEWMLWESVE